MGRGWQLGAHARAAAWLAAIGAPPSARAHHVERSATAGDEQAIALLTEAARAAAPRVPMTTGRWLQAAIGLLGSHAPAERRIGLHCEAGAAFAAAGAYEDSLQALESALALVQPERERERAELTVEVAEVKQQALILSPRRCSGASSWERHTIDEQHAYELLRGHSRINNRNSSTSPPPSSTPPPTPQTATNHSPALVEPTPRPLPAARQPAAPRPALVTQAGAWVTSSDPRPRRPSPHSSPPSWTERPDRIGKTIG
jgi:hypothetical protein